MCRAQLGASLRRDTQNLYFSADSVFKLPTTVSPRTKIHRPLRSLTSMLDQQERLPVIKINRLFNKINIIILVGLVIIGALISLYISQSLGNTTFRPWITDVGYRGDIKTIIVDGSIFQGDLEINSGILYVIKLNKFNGLRILHGMRVWSDTPGELEMVFMSMNDEFLCAGRGSISPNHAEGVGEKASGHGLKNGDQGIKVIIQLTGASKIILKNLYIKSQ